MITSGERGERHYVVISRSGGKRRNRTRTGLGVRRRKRIKVTTETSLREEGHNSDRKMGSNVLSLRNNSWLETEEHGGNTTDMLHSNEYKEKENGTVALTLENFDKETIKEVLENKEKKVGEVVLVEGRPAVIKKRKTLKKKGRKLKVHHPRKLKILKERKNSTVGGQLAKRRVRVKVKAKHGISLEDIEDQLQKRPDVTKKQKIRVPRPNRTKLRKRIMQNFSVFRPL